MMKKLVFIFCISLFAFSFLSCERNVDIYEDTSMQIKKIIRVTKPREVKEYRYKNQYIYRFASPVDGLYYVLYDKKGNFISEYGSFGINPGYCNDGVCPDFEEEAVFIRKIYPINN